MPQSGYYLLIAGDSRGDDTGQYAMILDLVASDAEGEAAATPQKFNLRQNYPNPFNPQTTIQFALPKESPVELAVFDILGRKVRGLISGSLPAGDHSIVWDGLDDKGKHASSGIYFYQLRAGTLTQTKKMALLK